MARPLSGTIEASVLADGTRAFRLRFRADGKRRRLVLHERTGCECGCGGGWDERAARRELGDVLARVRAGVWTPAERTPTSNPDRPRAAPTFHEYASHWLQAKIDGVLGDKPIRANTEADYRWRICGHLLPFFAHDRVDEIDPQRCIEFKTYKLREANELRDALASAADLRDRRGRRILPLRPSSIRKLVDTLAAILDDAVEDGLVERNPARGKTDADPRPQAVAELPGDGRARGAARRCRRAGRSATAV